MRIRKQYQVIPTNAKLENGDSTSATNGYTAEYINNHSVVVSPIEPTTDRKKVWMQKSHNMFPVTDIIVNQVGTSYSINVKPNTDYTLSYTKTRISGVTIGNQIVYDFQLIRYFNSSGTQISQETSTLYTLASGGELNINKSFTTPANTSYVTINLGNNNGDNNNNTLVSNIMLNEGSSALPYEPYVEDKTYILNNNVYEEFEPQNEIYSTEETRIGTWLGKPLYRKCYTGTTGTTDGVDLPTSNLDKLVNEGGYIAYTSSLLFPIPSTFGTDGANDIRVIKSSNSTLKIQHGSNLKSKGYELFVEYTKTTDD